MDRSNVHPYTHHRKHLLLLKNGNFGWPVFIFFLLVGFEVASLNASRTEWLYGDVLEVNPGRMRQIT